MSQADSAAKLYTPNLLALSVELAAFPHDPNAAFQGRASSRTCGSEVLLSASNAQLGQLGLQVAACAVGQAAAALFAVAAPGKDAASLEAQMQSLEQWLAGEGEAPDLARIHLIEPARAYPARHAAILLPWRAALDALA
ncbi:iron-sulfur cluster assembly scaffold protein [uncultured Erythrobacter sp.]|uniref:iron-sulfur cluster assembly scaffold protein n=1 Tax=uncultured Erythrobacter sp. TaxID=263913 RepID=UPI00261B50EE|nr:iron-sulfur cluster assembly scaffold protein [uncultured Erythrobacter sp.]